MIPKLCPWRRAALFLGVAAALSTLFAHPARAVSTDVVISQLYGSGGNSGSTYNYDYIELYNTSASAVDLSTYSVQYASATGAAFSGKTNLTGSIQPGKYFLIQEASNISPAPTSNLPVTPDLVATSTTGIFNMSGSNGRVALVNNQTLLGSTAANGAGVVDFVGYGTTAATFEGTGPAPVQNATTADIRKGTPPADTDNNANDFTAGAPNPHTGVTVAPPAITNAAFAPSASYAGTAAATTLSATVTPAAGATISSVTADVHLLTGNAGDTAVALTNGGSGNVYSANINVPAAAAAGAYAVTITATDNGARTNTATATYQVYAAGTPFTVAQARTQPLNSTILVRGIVTTNNIGNAYIQDKATISPQGGLQLFDGGNFDGTQIPLASDGTSHTLVAGEDVTFQGTMSTFGTELEFINLLNLTINSTGNAIPADKNISAATFSTPAGELAVEGQGLNVTDNVIVTQAPSTIAATGASAFCIVQDLGGHTFELYFPRNATAFASTPPGPLPAADQIPATNTAGVVSFPDVTIGNVYHVKGIASRFSATVMQLKLRRAGDLSFIGVATIIGATATPNFVSRGDSTVLAITTNPAAGSTVTADLTAFGGSATQALTYNAGNNDYEYTLNVSSTQTLGPTSIPISATNGSASQTGAISVTVITPLMSGLTIAQVRALPPYSFVSTTGTVTAGTVAAAGNYYIQDTNSPSGGILIFASSANDAHLLPGDLVTVTGLVKTFNGAKEIEYSPAPTGPDGSGVSSPAQGTVPNATIAPVAAWPNDPADLGKLIENQHLYILSVAAGAGSGNNAYYVTDGTSVGELFIHSRAVFAAGDLPSVGMTYDVTGIDEVFDNGTGSPIYEIKPRQPSDVVGGASAPVIIPNKLAFTTEPPTNTVAGATMAPVVVTVQDASGATDTNYTGPVTIAIGNNPAAGTLSGTKTVNAVNGVATFNNLSINNVGAGYTFVASVTGLTSATSFEFNITPAVVPGDTDKSGTVDNNDVILTLKVYAGLVAGNDPSVSIANGDVFPKGAPDGALTLGDAARIARSLHGLDTLP